MDFIIAIILLVVLVYAIITDNNMKQPKTHYPIQEGKTIAWVLCGKVINIKYCTRDKRKVTCKKCKKILGGK